MKRHKYTIRQGLALLGLIGLLGSVAALGLTRAAAEARREPDGAGRLAAERAAERNKGDVYLRTLDALAAEATARGDLRTAEQARLAKERFEHPSRNEAPIEQTFEKREVVR
ncbi:MAG: hypothetical protein R3B81_15265 [bacterium]